MSDLTQQQIIDLFKDAPEGATHYWQRMDVFYNFGEDDLVFTGGEWSPCSDISAFDGEITERPKPVTPTFTSENKNMKEALVLIIEHLSEFGVCENNSQYHASSIDTLIEPQQKAKWVAMNALGMLNTGPSIELSPGVCLFDINGRVGVIGELYFTTLGKCWMINDLLARDFHEAANCTNIQLLEVKS